MTNLAIYQFPHLTDLPNGFPIEIFREKPLLYSPGSYFTAMDNNDGYYVLMFPNQKIIDASNDSDGIWASPSDIINVKCKKIRSCK